MGLAAATTTRRFNGYMPTRPPARSATAVGEQPISEAAALGLALRRLRERAKMSQDDAAAAFGVSRQGWQVYEKGDRNGILRSDTQSRLATAVQATREELLTERARLNQGESIGTSDSDVVQLSDRRRTFELPIWGRARAGTLAPSYVADLGAPSELVDMRWLFGPDSGALRVAGESMSGYVESGQMVIFDRSRWPRRGDGCVIELANGELYVKDFKKTDGSTIFLQQRFPDEELKFPLSEVKGVYAIRLRGD